MTVLAITHDPGYLAVAGLTLTLVASILAIDLHRGAAPTRPCRCPHCRSIRR